MGLPWVRFDTSLPSHDKILALLSDPSSKRWQAYASYMSSICWSGGAGTDGRIPVAALPFVHGTHATARLLVKHGLWLERTAAWEIVNYVRRQPLAEVTEQVASGKRAAGAKGNCVRHHGEGCWSDERGCSRVA